MFTHTRSKTECGAEPHSTENTLSRPLSSVVTNGKRWGKSNSDYCQRRLGPPQDPRTALLGTLNLSRSKARPAPPPMALQVY